MKIRRMVDRDTRAVHDLYAKCHPTWPAKPEGFWWAHPTLVLIEADARLLGLTAFTVSIAPAPDLARLLPNDRGEVGWGHGVYVDPDSRGKGYGWRLAQARHAALRALEVPFFFGMTQPENAAMIAIFTRQGLTRGATIPKTYPDGSPGVLYHGGIV